MLRLSSLLACLPLAAALTGCSGTPVAPTDGGGSGGASCPGTVVNFRLEKPAGSTQSWCLGPPGGCGAGFSVGIMDSLGHALGDQIWCQVECDSCTARPCPSLACMPTQPLPAAGASSSWSGTYVVPGTCGIAVSQCLRKLCAAPGKYVAVMCAYPTTTGPDGGPECSAAPDGGSVETCVEVPFDYPATATVVGRLPSNI